MKRNPKLEIIEAILGKTNAAHDTMGGLIYSDSKKVILDFTPPISWENHLVILEELKKVGAIEDFESGDDCFYILGPSKPKLYELKRLLLSGDRPEQANTQKKLYFDLNNGKIIWGDKECGLPFKRMEYYIAKAIFERSPETKLTEDDLMAYIDPAACKADSLSRVYDTVRRINQRVSKDLGIKRLIVYKESNYWINKIE